MKLKKGMSIFVLCIPKKNINYNNSSTNNEIKQKDVHLRKFMFILLIKKKNINYNNSNTNNAIKYDSIKHFNC